MKRRDERTFDRKLLELAKQRHITTFGAEVKLNRVKIRRFKKEIRREIETGEI
jgi:hypothetical protein